MNRFDIVLGHLVFYSLWHNGQSDPFYVRLGRILGYFRPSPFFNETRFFESDDYADAVAVYDALCAKHGVETHDDDKGTP